MSALLCGPRPAWLRFDLLAGITAAAVVLPQAIAYATVAGLPLRTVEAAMEQARSGARVC